MPPVNFYQNIVAAIPVESSPRNGATVKPRLRRLNRSRTCQRCGTTLQPALRQKYDPFWVLVLIFVGATLAFFLVGIVLMLIGLRMLSSKESRWACPACAAKEPYPATSLCQRK